MANDPEEGRLLASLTKELLKMEGLVPKTEKYKKQLAKCEAAEKALKDYKAARDRK